MTRTARPSTITREGMPSPTARSSIIDIAGAVGVSPATVSRALRGLPNVSQSTRDRVQRAADDLGYVRSADASGLASGRTMSVGIVVPTLASWFCDAVIEGVDSVMRPAGYDLVLFSLGRHDGIRDRVLRQTLRRRTDALIAVCADLDAGERRQLASFSGPVVIAGAATRGLLHVAVDQRAAARDAVQHLVDLGHTRIGHLGDAYPSAGFRAIADRRRDGFVSGMETNGLDLRVEWSTRVSSPAGAHEALGRMLQDPFDRPTALLVDSDERAAEVVTAATAFGLRVPADLSVICFEDRGLARPFRLTAVAQSPAEQGVTAARMLLADLDSPPVRRRSATFPVHIDVRDSTAAPQPPAPA